MTPVHPARRHRPYPRARPQFRPRPNARAVLAVEPLEGRVEPSVVGWSDVFPVPDGAAAALITFTSLAVAEDYFTPDVSARDAPAAASPTVPLTGSPVGPHRRELLLVEFDVPARDELVSDLLAQPGADAIVGVVWLNGGGATEIASALGGYSGLDAIHLISHGSPGRLALGEAVLDAITLPDSAADLCAWGAALSPGGDLLLYGCDVAAGAGREFVTRLGSLTGADVAASFDVTGSAAGGGNWALESVAGAVEATPLAAPGTWTYVLGPAGTVNAAPVAADDFYTTALNLGILATPLTVSAPGVLANDTDGDGDPLTAQLVTGPANGLFGFNPNGSFTYTGLLNYTGIDSFTYRVTDGTTWSAPATVFINVSSPNRPPAAAADAYTATEDTPLVEPAVGVLGNDADPDGDSLTAELVTAGAHGTVVLDGDGSFTYSPEAGFVGTDTFDYRVTDGGLDSAPVTVTVVVRASPAPATAPQPTATGSNPTGPTAAGTGSPPAAPTPPPTPAAPTAPATTPGIPVSSATARGFGSPLPTTFVATPAGGTATSTITTTPVVVTTVGSVASGTHATFASYGGQVFAPADAAGDGAAPVAVAPPPSLPPEAKPIPAPPPSEVVGPVVPPGAPAAGAPPVGPAAAVAGPAPVAAPSDAVLASLDQARADLRADAAARATTDALVVSGGVVVAGYALLNTRVVYWFLGAVLARPAVWRRFDPLEVVYAWEQEGGDRRRAADPGATESLQSIVG